MTLEGWRWHLSRHVGTARLDFPLLLQSGPLLVNTDSQYFTYCMFGHFFICTLIDAIRQVLRLMVFISLTWCIWLWETLLVHSLWWTKQSLCFPTSSDRLQWVWHLAMEKTTVHYSEIWPRTNVIVTNKHMQLWNWIRNRKTCTHAAFRSLQLSMQLTIAGQKIDLRKSIKIYS